MMINGINYLQKLSRMPRKSEQWTRMFRWRRAQQSRYCRIILTNFNTRLNGKNPALDLASNWFCNLSCNISLLGNAYVRSSKIPFRIINEEILIRFWIVMELLVIFNFIRWPSVVRTRTNQTLSSVSRIAWNSKKATKGENNFMQILLLIWWR